MKETINYLVSITTTKIPNAKPHLVRCPADQIQTLMFEFPNSIFFDSRTSGLCFTSRTI